MEVTQRTCTKCKETKDIKEFHKTSSKYTFKDTRQDYTYRYYHAKCKECRCAERNAAYWHSDKFYQGRKIGGQR